MDNNSPAEPLHAIIRRLRNPHSFREIIAACLRSIYMGDPFSGEKDAIPAIPQHLIDEVTMNESLIAGRSCKIYSPKESAEKLPFMLYMHGGGFVIGSADDTDYITRMLCYSNKMVIISVNYRLAPEVPFPGALDDCEAVFASVITDTNEYNINSSQLFLGGDSAGGNLAMALVQRLKKQKYSIQGLVLLAPWLDMKLEKYASYNVLAPKDIVMDAAFLAYARASYVGFRDWSNPLVSPILCDLNSLPPTIIVVGDEDPLVDQTIDLRATISLEKKTDINIKVIEGMPHCFYSFPNIFEEEKSCYKTITAFINRIKNSSI